MFWQFDILFANFGYVLSCNVLRWQNFLFCPITKQISNVHTDTIEIDIINALGIFIGCSN